MKILIPIFRMKKLTEVKKGCPVSASGEEHLDVSTHFLNPRLKLFPPLHLSPRAFKHSSDCGSSEHPAQCLLSTALWIQVLFMVSLVTLAVFNFLHRG